MKALFTFRRVAIAAAPRNRPGPQLAVKEEQTEQRPTQQERPAGTASEILEGVSASTTDVLGIATQRNIVPEQISLTYRLLPTKKKKPKYWTC